MLPNKFILFFLFFFLLVSMIIHSYKDRNIISLITCVKDKLTRDSNLSETQKCS